MHKISRTHLSFKNGQKYFLGTRQDLMGSLIYGRTTFVMPRFICDSGGFCLIPLCTNTPSIFNLLDHFISGCKAVMFSQASCISKLKLFFKSVFLISNAMSLKCSWCGKERSRVYFSPLVPFQNNEMGS